MSLRCQLAVSVGKLVRFMLRILGRQASTLPGRVTLALHPKALAQKAAACRIAAVTGTNGKTTTTALITNLLQAAGRPYHTNRFGANLASGLMTALLDAKAGDLAVLEVDEAALAACGQDLAPAILVVTNLSPDQLDRFGSLTNIINLVEVGSQSAGELVLCLDDPHSRDIGAGKDWQKKTFFGLAERDRANRAIATGAESGDQTAPAFSAKAPSDSRLVLYRREQIISTGETCTACLHLTCRGLGEAWSDLQVKFPLPGAYNAANAAAAVAAASGLVPGLTATQIVGGLETAKPQFGRLERLTAGEHKICLVLIKNEAGFKATAEMLSEQADLGGLIFVINNNPADGEDISWFSTAGAHRFLPGDIPYGAAGLCRKEVFQILAEELAERTDQPQLTCADEADALPLVEAMLADLPPGKTLYVLPNYTAMMTLQPALQERFG